MEKIVVLTGDSSKDDNLINCLKMLFPECDIEIHSRQPKTNSSDFLPADHLDEDLLDDKLNKFMSFL